MYCGARTDYRFFRKHSYKFLLTSLALLGAVLLIGSTINSAKRWIFIGPISFQPSEFAKLALTIYLADSLSRKNERIKTFTIGFVPHLVVAGLMMVLLLVQPDYGSAVIIGATTIVLLFVAGARISYILGVVLMTAPLAYHLIVGTPWRLRRFLAFFNPEAYADGVAYQLIQAKIALGVGGLTGVGLGQGKQQLGYMIEGHNDFIMACIGEELGFIGFAAVVLLFALIVIRGVWAARNASDTFGCYLALGISIAFAIQALVNLGVVLGLLPNKGLTLPLVSYGGSSLLLACYLIGLLLNISKSAPPKVRSTHKKKALANKRKQRAVVVCES